MPIYTGAVTYREFAERVKARLRQRARENADVHPSIYYYDGAALGEVAIPPPYFNNRSSKDALASFVLPALIREMRPRYFGIQYELWEVAVNVTSDEQRHEVEAAFERMEYPDSIGQPSKHPDRFETIHLHVLDAERHEVFRAIKRKRRKGIQLGDWQDLGVDAMHGLMIDPIKEAMR